MCLTELPRMPRKRRKYRQVVTEMATKYSPGDKAFIVESNYLVREVDILKTADGLVTVRFAEGKGGMRVRESRLFAPGRRSRGA